METDVAVLDWFFTESAFGSSSTESKGEFSTIFLMPDGTTGTATILILLDALICSYSILKHPQIMRRICSKMARKGYKMSFNE